MSVINRHDDPVLCVVCPQLGAPSETFIKKHIELIAPKRTVVLTGGILDPEWVSCPVKQIPIRIGHYRFAPDFEAEVLEFLKQSAVTHILCEFGCIGGAVIELNASSMRLPVYVHFHGQDASEYIKVKEMVDYYHWIGETVDGVIAVSNPMKDRLIGIGIPPDKLHVIHSGVDVPQNVNSHPEVEPCRFLAVSRFVPKKGCIQTLMAFESATAEDPDSTLDVIGDGPMRPEIEAFIEAHGLQSRVTLHGTLPNAEVLSMMDRSSVFIQHSMTDPATGNREGIPVSVIEAAAHALPIVSTRHEGIPEVVEENISGYLVDEGDWVSMADCIVKLEKDPFLRKKMGFMGRKKIIETDFSTEAMLSAARGIMGLPESIFSPKCSKVLLVNHAIPPMENSGTPITTLNHALGLQARGLNVAVLVPSRNAVPVGFTKEDSNGVTIYRVPGFDNQKAFLGTLDRKALKLYLAMIAYIARDFSPDIVHVNDYVGMPAEIIALLHDLDFPLVRNVCNDEEICHQNYPVISTGATGELCSGPDSPDKCAQCYLIQFKGMDKDKIQQDKKDRSASFISAHMDTIRALYREKIDAVVFTSTPFKKHFTTFVPIEEDKVRIIPRGFAPSQRRKPDQQEKAAGNKVRFAFFGTLMFSKGIDVLLKAFSRIASVRKSFRLDLYGIPVDQKIQAWLQRLTDEHPEHIYFHGEYAHDQMAGLIDRIDLAVVPSYFDTYNRIVRECLQYGVPVLCTDFFGAFIIRDGFNGLKVPIGDDEALAEAMKRVIDEPGLVENLRAGARNTEIPSLKDEISAMIELYEEVLSERKEEQPKLPDKKNKGSKSFYTPKHTWSRKGERYLRDIDSLLQSILDNSVRLPVRCLATLFLNTGTGFNELETVRERIDSGRNGSFRTVFDLRGFKEIRGARFDPWKGFWGRLRLEEIVAQHESGRRMKIAPTMLQAINGVMGLDGFYTFRTCDPIIEIPELSGCYDSLIFKGRLELFDPCRMETEWAGERAVYQERLYRERGEWRERVTEKDREINNLRQLLSVARIIRDWHESGAIAGPLILFGTGTMAEWVLQLLDRSRFPVRCCFDNRPFEALFHDIEVLKPVYVPEVQVIIASMFHEEIRKQLRDLGYGDEDLLILQAGEGTN